MTVDGATIPRSSLRACERSCLTRFIRVAACGGNVRKARSFRTPNAEEAAGAFGQVGPVWSTWGTRTRIPVCVGPAATESEDCACCSNQARS